MKKMKRRRRSPFWWRRHAFDCLVSDQVRATRDPVDVAAADVLEMVGPRMFSPAEEAKLRSRYGVAP